MTLPDTASPSDPARPRLMSSLGLARATYDTVDSWYRQGAVSQDEWEAYCHVWRTSSFRYSSVAAGYEAQPDDVNVRAIAAEIRVLSLPTELVTSPLEGLLHSCQSVKDDGRGCLAPATTEVVFDGGARQVACSDVVHVAYVARPRNELRCARLVVHSA